MSQVHVCLLSDQLLPNLIPILMERPSRVYLIVSPEIQQSGKDKRMEIILRKKEIDVRLCQHAPSTGFEAIREFATKLAGELVSAESGNLIILNVTGGTKLLAIGFIEIFRARLKGSLRVIYTDTGHGMIETLVPPGEAPSPMRDVLDAESYLEAQGLTLISAASDEKKWIKDVNSRELNTRFLVENWEPLSGLSGILNPMETQAGETSALAKEFRSGLREKARTLLTDAGLVEDWDRVKSIEDLSRDARIYLTGGWLEEYAWLSARLAGLKDAKCAAKLRWGVNDDLAGPGNELDLLVVHDNKMLIVECKTGKISSKGTQGLKIAALLESLKRNVGGNFCDGLLVHAGKLPSAMKKRCEKDGITTLEQGSLTELKSRLEVWRDNANT